MQYGLITEAMSGANWHRENWDCAVLFFDYKKECLFDIKKRPYNSQGPFGESFENQPIRQCREGRNSGDA
jgi:hypothetical protein